MDRDLRDILKILAVIAALVGALVAAVLLVMKYHEQISDFFAELKMKCPCHREEDDYADEELNCICDMENITE